MDAQAVLQASFEELRITPRDQHDISVLMELLKIKDLATYEHSIRVGQLARKIGSHIQLGEKALFFAGTLHDIGKTSVPVEVLRKNTGWTKKDGHTMQGHVLSGYCLLRDRFRFTADVMLYHHRFQKRPYPSRLPEPLPALGFGTRVLIPVYGRMLALADSYDALHRVNDKFSEEPAALDDEQIKAAMLHSNPDARELIYKLYDAGIFS